MDISMARTRNHAAHALRRDSFVDTAQRLIQTKGYEQMSIQDVLDDLDTSRGAFYHYFDSKAALLEAVVERMVDGALHAIAPVVTDPDLAALDKLTHLIEGIGQWKAERTDLVLGILPVWQADDNAIVREKLRRGVQARLAPMLAAIVQQGREEGVFAAGPADQVARVLVTVLLGANEAATDLYFARQAGTVDFDEVVRTLEAYPAACERILGLSPGSFPIFDTDVLRQWYG
jgi:AcrR family transcriptional regulator